jgi:hypothetical protein
MRYDTIRFYYSPTASDWDKTFGSWRSGTKLSVRGTDNCVPTAKERDTFRASSAISYVRLAEIADEPVDDRIAQNAYGASL